LIGSGPGHGGTRPQRTARASPPAVTTAIGSVGQTLKRPSVPSWSRAASRTPKRAAIAWGSTEVSV
jgi:hypothetical protein